MLKKFIFTNNKIMRMYFKSLYINLINIAILLFYYYLTNFFKNMEIVFLSGEADVVIKHLIYVILVYLVIPVLFIYYINFYRYKNLKKGFKRLKESYPLAVDINFQISMASFFMYLLYRTSLINFLNTTKFSPDYINRYYTAPSISIFALIVFITLVQSIALHKTINKINSINTKKFKINRKKEIKKQAYTDNTHVDV